jgi:protein translocase SecG subunit
MVLDLLQLLIAISLTTIIVIQAKGSGLGSTFGGQSQTYHSKRGVEKAIFTTTIILAVLFTLVSMLNFGL